MHSLFPTNKAIIGMLHLPPMVGFEAAPSMEYVLEKAYQDLDSLVMWGVDAIMIENNYDLPHTRILDPEVLVQMTLVCDALRKHTTLPIGICCLWNDWKAALSIAKFAQLQFVRIPVFVDHVRTHYGYEIQEDPAQIIEYKNHIGAQDIRIITDIHVKHSEILNSDSLEMSAKKAIAAGSDGLIITGKWTGDLPLMADLESVRAALPDAFIISGSWVTVENAPQVFQVCDAAIVGTSLKTNTQGEHAINVRTFDEMIDQEKVFNLMKKVREI